MTTNCTRRGPAEQVAYDRGVGQRCVSHRHENPYDLDRQPALHAAWEMGWDTTDREANTEASPEVRIAELERALSMIRSGSETALRMFRERIGERSYPTWYAVNVLQDAAAATEGTASRALNTFGTPKAEG